MTTTLERPALRPNRRYTDEGSESIERHCSAPGGCDSWLPEDKDHYAYNGKTEKFNSWCKACVSQYRKTNRAPSKQPANGSKQELERRIADALELLNGADGMLFADDLHAVILDVITTLA